MDPGAARHLPQAPFLLLARGGELSRQRRATLTGHTGPMLAVAIAPDSSWLATASEDGTAVWDAATGPLIAGRPREIRLHETWAV